VYRTCLHCRENLGANESLEALPIGRRVAFDAANGRLWVVCRKCERWNLTPFETRWEAIEQAERAFRDTRVRVSTDNIGLARMRDGTDLVRVGTPLRPEFAAWRYGDQFGKRRLKSAIMATGAVAGVGLLGAGAFVAAGSVVALFPLVHIITVMAAFRGFTSEAPIAHPEGGLVTPFGNPRLVAGDRGAEWGIEVGYSEWYDVVDGHTMSRVPDSWLQGKQKNEIGRVRLYGHEAMPLLRITLPRVNRAGAPRATIRESVALIEDAGGPERFGHHAGTQLHRWAAHQSMGDNGDLQYIPAPARLAFEMALHEDSERRAMDGELAELERAWRDAEGVAAIADGLLVPEVIEARVRELRGDG